MHCRSHLRFGQKLRELTQGLPNASKRKLRHSTCYLAIETLNPKQKHLLAQQGPASVLLQVPGMDRASLWLHHG